MRPAGIEIPGLYSESPHSGGDSGRTMSFMGRSRAGTLEHLPEPGSHLRPSRASDSAVGAPSLGPKQLLPDLSSRSETSPVIAALRHRGATAVETIRAYSLLLGRALSPRPPPEVLVWSDEFDYEGLPDPAKWSYQTESNRWTSRPENAEQQWYTKECEKNAIVSNGTLKITARYENYAGCLYTSARLITRGKGDFLYGRVEVSAKLPAARPGIWPAIWMLPSDQLYGPWPKSGELDLMENVGFAEGVVRSSIHTERCNHRDKTHHMGSTTRKHAHSRFHVYSLEWSPTKIAIFVDSQCTLTLTRKEGVHDPGAWPFDQRFHLVLNVAVGGHWAGQHGIDNSMFPTSMEIAYVRVFQRPGPQGVVQPGRVDATERGGASSVPSAFAPLSAGEVAARDATGSRGAEPRLSRV